MQCSWQRNNCVSHLILPRAEHVALLLVVGVAAAVVVAHYFAIPTQLQTPLEQIHLTSPVLPAQSVAANLLAVATAMVRLDWLLLVHPLPLIELVCPPWLLVLVFSTCYLLCNGEEEGEWGKGNSSSFVCHVSAIGEHKITTMFAALGRRTALHAARRTAQQQAKRRMGGGAAAAPEWTGIDKVVRGYFPKDEDSEFFLLLFYFL